MSISIEQIRNVREQAFLHRDELSIAKKIGLALLMAVLTGLLAQIRLPLPFTPVPLTGQTFAALLAGVLLGSWWGGLSLAIYAILGVAGVPWFNGWTGGLAHVAGPTGGYIIGFIIAALFVGHFMSRHMATRTFPRLLALMLFANFALIYITGLLHLGLWLNLVSNKAIGVTQLFNMGLVPFIPGDIIKCVAAAGIAWAILPRSK